MNRLKIRIIGKNPDYFLHELINRNINIYNLFKTYNYLEIIINYEDYKIIKEIKTSYKITIINRYGINKYKSILKRYNLFFICIIIGIIINIILSNIIFDVEVINPNKKLVNQITKDLKELGLKKYHLKINYQNKELLEKKLLEKENNILEWIEIEEKGTRYIVNVEERKKNKKEKKCRERHIISRKNALIMEINAESGEIIKKKNDYVSKGEIIVSGFIHNKDKITSKTCAKGTIYGETWYRVKTVIPKVDRDEKLLDNYSYGISINFFNFSYKNKLKLRNYKKYEYNIIRSRYIPINISFIKYQETKIRYHKKTNKLIEEEALKVASRKIEENLIEDEAIISKKVLKKSENNSKIIVEVFFKVKENITAYQDITKINIDDLNKEEE